MVLTPDWKIGFKKKIKKQIANIYYLQETHLIKKEAYTIMVKGWKMIFHVTTAQRQIGITILFSNTIDFKPKLARTDKGGHYIQFSKRGNNYKYLCVEC